MIIVKEFAQEDKEQLFDLIKEINEYDGNFEGADNITKITDYNSFLKSLEKRAMERCC